MFGLFRLMATIAACATSVASVHAADFREGFIRSEVVLEGTIEAGDYDKLRTFVEENSPRSIYLASPGGNLAEAIKMGRLVRALKLKTMVPSEKNPRFRDKLADMNKLKNPETNYMCASACFFVFVAGVNRITDNFSDEPILGIHRPYLSENDLKGMNGDQAIAAASQTRMKVENYLKEMGIQTKYSDRMFLVPKNEVRWISEDDFEADFKGFIPELQDWIAAKCDTRTDVEKAAWENLKDKSPARMTAAERLISDMLKKKMSELDDCSSIFFL